MLFITENGFLDVVYEPNFKNVFTLQTNDFEALKKFAPHTPAKIMRSRRATRYPYMLHVRKEIVAKILGYLPILFEAEVLDKPISANAPLFLLEGVDVEYASEFKLLAEPDELPGIQKSLAQISDLAIYPVYSTPDAMMEGGGSL